MDRQLAGRQHTRARVAYLLRARQFSPEFPSRDYISSVFPLSSLFKSTIRAGSSKLIMDLTFVYTCIDRLHIEFSKHNIYLQCTIKLWPDSKFDNWRTNPWKKADLLSVIDHLWYAQWDLINLNQNKHALMGKTKRELRKWKENKFVNWARQR